MERKRQMQRKEESEKLKEREMNKNERYFETLNLLKILLIRN